MSHSTAHLLPAHQTMLLAHRAMVRDLDRIARTAVQLSASPDPEWAAALASYTDTLFLVIEHHHAGEDEFLWPRLRQLGADEAALNLMTREHKELAKFLHAWHESTRRLASGSEAAAEVAQLTEDVRSHLARHAGHEELELLGRLAPALSKQLWSDFSAHMRKTAPSWAVRFLPAWLLSVAGPGEGHGVPLVFVGRLFSGWLEKRQRSAFGSNY
ncbi:hemerythrin domain-containing protein [Streptomyces roseifaciens]